VAYVMRYGSFDFEKIPQLMNKLLLADLLTLRPMSRLREILERNRRNPAARAMAATLHAIERLNVSSRRWNELFERIHRYGGWLLFTPMAVLGLGVLSAFGVRSLFLLWNDLGAISSALGHHAIVAIIALKLAFFLTVALHQLVHALACVHYGRRVKEVGFIIHHLVVPTFYADVTDLFMASRRARVVNALAGPTVHLVLGLLGAIWSASAYIGAFGRALNRIYAIEEGRPVWKLRPAPSKSASGTTICWPRSSCSPPMSRCSRPRTPSTCWTLAARSP